MTALNAFLMTSPFQAILNVLCEHPLSVLFLHNASPPFFVEYVCLQSYYKLQGMNGTEDDGENRKGQKAKHIWPLHGDTVIT